MMPATFPADDHDHDHDHDHDDETLLMQFQREFLDAEAESDRNEIAERFCAASPALAERFRKLAARLQKEEEVLFRFQTEYEDDLDPEAVLRRYCSEWPAMTQQIREHAAMLRQLDAARPDASPQVPMPERLGRFEVIRRLAHGGMGEIYLAWDADLHRFVAVKVMRQGMGSPTQRDRFRREQHALARRHETHTVPIYEAGQEGPIQFFAMHYINGATLHHFITAVLAGSHCGRRHEAPSLDLLAQKLIPAPTTVGSANTVACPTPSSPPPCLPDPRPDVHLSLAYFRSVAQVAVDASMALHAAHQSNLVHRDIKPANLMIDRSGYCWVIDFGIAGLFTPQNRPQNGPQAAPDSILAASPILTNGWLGTPGYMAPEQWQCEPTDARTDVWGLGATLYELLTLRRAFPGPSPEVMRSQTTQEPLPAPRMVRPEIPADLAAICAMALRQDPRQRYASAKELADDLRRWLGGYPTVARPRNLFGQGWMLALRNPGWGLSILLTLVTLFTLVLATTLLGQAAQAEARQQRFEVARQDIELIRLSPHVNDWSAKSWARVVAATAIRKDPALQGPAASLLAGLDARKVKQFAPGNSVSVAYADGGTQLLLGGSSARGKQAGQPPRLWDQATTRVVPFKGPLASGKVVFGKDGQPLQLTPGQGTTVELWDLDKQTVLQRFDFEVKPGFPQAISLAQNHLSDAVMAVSKHGAVVAAAATAGEQQGIVAVWDVAVGKLLGQFRADATAMAFSPEGHFLAVADATGRVVVWSVREGKPALEPLKAGTFIAHALAFSPDADRTPATGPRGRLAVGGGASQLVIWEVEKRIATRCLGSPYDVFAVAFNLDGTLVASGGRETTRIWEASTGRLQLEIETSDFVTGLTFSPDGTHLATSNLLGFTDAFPTIWALEDGRGIQTLRGPTAQVGRLRFSPNSKYVASLGHDWQVSIWEQKANRLLHQLEIPSGPLVTADNGGLIFSNDGKSLAAVSGQQARRWDVVSGKEVGAWNLPRGLANLTLFANDGKQLLLCRLDLQGDRQGRVVVRDLQPNGVVKELYVVQAFNGRIRGGAASQLRGRFAILGEEKPNGTARMEVIEAATGARVWMDRTTDFAQAANLVLDPTESLLVVPTKPGLSQMLDFATGKYLRDVHPGPSALGPNGHLFTFTAPDPLTGANRHGLFEMVVGQNKLLATLGRATAAMSMVITFNPAGTHIAWGNQDGTISVADLAEVNRRLTGVGLGW